MKHLSLLAAGLLAAGCATKSPISREMDRLEAAQKKYHTKDIKPVGNYLVIGKVAYVRLVISAESEETHVLAKKCREADKNRDKYVTLDEVSALE